MPGEIDKAKEGLAAVGTTAKKHYLVVAVIALLLLVLAVRYRGQIATWLSGILPASLKPLLGLATFVVFVGVSLFALDASAAMCCSKAAVHASPLWLKALYVLGTAGPALGAVAAYGAADVRECKVGLSGSEKFARYNAADAGFQASGAGPNFDFYVNGEVNTDKDGRPLVAVSHTVELDCTVDQVTGGSDIYDDDLPLLFDSISMEENNVIGTLLPTKVASGPRLKLMEFFDGGWNRGADAPVATMVVPTAPDTHNVKSFTRYLTIHHANHLIKDPFESALPLWLINKMAIRCKLAGSTALGAVSVGALSTKTTSTLRVGTNFVPYNFYRWPTVINRALDTPDGGNSVKLSEFGQEGPTGTEPIDWVYLLARLFDVANLGGNCTFDNVTSFSCDKWKMPLVENMNMQFKNRLEAQIFARSESTYENNPNFQQGAVPTGMNRADAKFYALIQPGLSMVLDSMLKVTKGYEVTFDWGHTVKPTTKDAYLIQSMRQLSKSVGPKIMQLTKGRLSGTNRAEIVPYTQKPTLA